KGDAVLETVVKGDRVDQVLGYMQYQSSELMHRLQTAVESAVHEKRLDQKSAGRLLKFYEDGLRGYTYLEESGEE
ncbi:MAG: arginine decarboxylase, partial [Planctomycetaceae bacterium]